MKSRIMYIECKGDVLSGPGQMLVIWTAEPGSKSAQALSLLGSWAATPQQPELQDATDYP